MDLRYRLRRLRLLVKADLKILFFSPWFYLILAMASAIVYSFTLIQPRDDLTRILVLDEVDNPVSRELLMRLSEVGYRVERLESGPGTVREKWDLACEEMKRDRAFAVIHLTSGFRIRYRVYSYLAEEIVRYTLERILEQYRFEAYQRDLVLRGASWPDLETVARPFLANVGEGHDQVAVVIVSGIWYLCGITTLILWIMSKDGFAKLMRVYSFSEILVARMLAGTLLGLILAVVFFTTAVVLDIRFHSLAGLITSGVFSAVTGVCSGLFLGAFALAMGGSIFSLMLIGLLGLTLLFLLLTIISGVFTPLGGLPALVQTLGTWMPLFAQIELLRWSALAGHPLTSPLCVKLMCMLLLVNVVQFALSLIFLRRL